MKLRDFNASKETLEDFFDIIFNPDITKRIIITPLINKKHIKSGVVDLRLGTEFILAKKTKYSDLDPKEGELSKRIKSYQEKVIIRFKDHLVLHPNQFILGCTLEYIKLPKNVMGYIIGRSSWGRIGLIIATAILINPGFAGVITLELTNVGDVPLILYPGLRIAQITFHKCDYKLEREDIKKSKYFGSTGPSFSEIYLDKDLYLFGSD